MAAPRATTRRRRPESVQEALPFVLPEGVHIGLPQDTYFGSRAIGSSDLDTLATDAHSWWYGSPFNADRGDRKKRDVAKTFGSALHALILEGEDAYTTRFVVQPDEDSARYAKGIDQVRQLLIDKGVRFGRGDLFHPPTLDRLVRGAGLQNRVWEIRNADYLAARKKGLDVITEDEDRRLRHMSYLVSSHDDLRVLKGGMAEVSVLWRDPRRPGVLKRARFDKLLPPVSRTALAHAIDLKSFGNVRDKSVDEATFDAIADYSYDLQAEHYREAFEAAREFVGDGAIHGWSQRPGAPFPESVEVLRAEREMLKAIFGAEQWLWVWIFYQVRNDAPGQEKAPIIRPWYTRPQGRMFNDARRVIEKALDNYERLVGEFSLGRPWSEILPIEELPLERLKRLSIKRSLQL